MGSISRLDRCDRFCTEFGDIVKEKLTIKSKAISNSGPGIDPEREVVMFFQQVKDTDRKVWVLAHPYILFDPSTNPEDEMGVLACRLGLKLADVRRRFKKAKLL
jgi:hypothetical protein